MNGKKAEWSRELKLQPRPKDSLDSTHEPLHSQWPFCSVLFRDSVSVLAALRGHDLEREGPVPGGADSLPRARPYIPVAGSGRHHSVHCLIPFSALH